MVMQVTPMRPGQKTLVGTVISDKMDKTVVVAVASQKRHRLYGKTLRRTKHYKAHDPENTCKLGDTVRMGASYAPRGDEAYADAAFVAAAEEARRHARHVTVLAATGDEHEAARLAAHGFVPAATRVSLTAPGDG